MKREKKLSLTKEIEKNLTNYVYRVRIKLSPHVSAICVCPDIEASSRFQYIVWDIVLKTNLIFLHANFNVNGSKQRKNKQK